MPLCQLLFCVCVCVCLPSPLQALCEVYNRPAEIYAYDAEHGARKLRTFHRAREGGAPIRLSYYGGGARPQSVCVFLYIYVCVCVRLPCGVGVPVCMYPYVRVCVCVSEFLWTMCV